MTEEKKPSVDWPELTRLWEAATPGPWEPDTEDCDGSYGLGEDVHEGYKAQIMCGPRDFHGKPEVLFDTINSTAAEVRDEYDEDGHYAWDEVAARNFKYIAALHNAFPAIRDERAAMAARIEENARLLAEANKLLLETIAERDAAQRKVEELSAGGWRDMESAPSLTKIIVMCGPTVDVAYRNEHGSWRYGGSSQRGRGIDYWPSYWMPLPGTVPSPTPDIRRAALEEDDVDRIIGHGHKLAERVGATFVVDPAKVEAFRKASRALISNGKEGDAMVATSIMFDPTQPFRTRDGEEVRDFKPSEKFAGSWRGWVKGVGELGWFADGSRITGEESGLDLVNLPQPPNQACGAESDPTPPRYCQKCDLQKPWTYDDCCFPVCSCEKFEQMLQGLKKETDARANLSAPALPGQRVPDNVVYEATWSNHGADYDVPCHALIARDLRDCRAALRSRPNDMARAIEQMVHKAELAASMCDDEGRAAGFQHIAEYGRDALRAAAKETAP